MRGDVKVFPQVEVIDLIPDAFLLPRHHHALHPVRGLVIQPIAALGVDVRVEFHIHKRNRDLAELSLFVQVEVRFLVLNLDGVDPARIRVPFAVDLVPRAVEVVAEFAVFLDGGDLHHLVLAEVMDFVCAERRRVVERNAADGHASLRDGRRRGDGAAGFEVFEREGERARGGKFEELAAGNLRVEHDASLTGKGGVLFRCY